MLPEPPADFSSRAQEKVIAVILTHNGAARALERCAELVCQTRPPNEIILVDNASTDGTAERIARQFPQVRILRLTENLGPAGGYAAGFSAAMKGPCDYIWAIDDDVIVSVRCLEDLLGEALRTHLSVVFPTRLPDKLGGVGWHGVIVPTAIVRLVGVPRADFFWWMEDTEYFLYRIRDVAGFKLMFSSKATVWHRAYRPRRGYPGWKFYYETRNTMYYRLYINRNFPKHFRNFIRLTGRLVAVLFREERRLMKARLIIRGFKDGFLGVIGKTVDPSAEPPAAMYRKQHHMRQLVDEAHNHTKPESATGHHGASCV